MDKVKNIASIVGLIVPIVTLLLAAIEPFAEDYIDKRIDLTFKEQKQKDTSKESLRKLLSNKMNIDTDEVHIELGRLYTSEKTFKKSITTLIDSLEANGENVEMLYDRLWIVIDANTERIANLEQK
tara:strand:+ start:975 stop:1352 length:378 start_codon:yes stop_codon:yes gene_type:complete